MSIKLNLSFFLTILLGLVLILTLKSMGDFDIGCAAPIYLKTLKLLSFVSILKIIEKSPKKTHRDLFVNAFSKASFHRTLVAWN